MLLVRPASFGFHAEAAQSNAFANAPPDADVATVAAAEFEGFAASSREARVEVLVLEDLPEPEKPDAIFPNNWVSFHADGTMVLYPMATEARRLERNVDGLKTLLSAVGLRRAASGRPELSRAPRPFPRRHRKPDPRPTAAAAFASLSPRTDPVAIADFDDRLDYSTFVFDARDRSDRPIYHTNVLLSLGTPLRRSVHRRGHARISRAS